MSARLDTQVVDPSTLSPAELDALIEQLAPLVSAGLVADDAAALRRRIQPAAATRGRVELLREPGGAVRGFVALHLVELDEAEPPCTVALLDAVLDRRVRGHAPLGVFMAVELGRYRLAHPGRDLVLAAPVQHPSSLRLLNHVQPGWAPVADSEQAADLARTGGLLADRLGLPAPDPAQPLLRRLGSGVRETAEERAFWARSEDPAVRAFLAGCPGYVDGLGLLVLHRLDLSALARTVGRLSARQVGQRWQEAAEVLQRLGLRAPVPVEEARALLAQSRVLELASAEALDALAARVERYTCGPGKVLMQQGASPDALYVIVEGSALVLLERGEGQEPVVLDQLGKGAVVGEMGLLMGEPRSATVQAVDTLTALRLSRQALLEVLRAHEDLAEQVWRIVARRRLDATLLDSERFQGQDPAARRWLVEAISPTHLPARTTRTVLCPGTLFVVTGRVEVEADLGWTSLRGPALLPCVGPARCHARTDAVVAVAPPLHGLGG